MSIFFQIFKFKVNKKTHVGQNKRLLARKNSSIVGNFGNLKLCKIDMGCFQNKNGKGKKPNKDKFIKSLGGKLKKILNKW